MRDKSILLREIPICSMFVVIPIAISGMIYFFFHVPVPLSCVGIYTLLVIFMLPSDNIFSANLDYQTKQINPDYRPNKNHSSFTSSRQIIHLVIVILALVVSIMFLVI